MENLTRTLTTVNLLPGGKIAIDGTEYINFSSNDYLGLSHHPGLQRAVASKSRAIFGVASSRLLTGNDTLHAELEEKTAAFKQKEDCLIYNSGYQANIGIISALFGKGDVVFCDKLSHASIIDGIKLSGAKLVRYKHNDMDHLKSLLEKERKSYDKALLVTESVFSMDGDVAPLCEIVELKKEHDVILMVDEAHATGIFGSNGEGLVGEYDLSGACDIVMGTFSKALGGFGAYAACSKEMKHRLLNTSRSFIYSTALPLPVVAFDIASLEIVRDEPQRRESLLSKTCLFRAQLKELGITALGSTHIVPIVVGDSDKALLVCEKIKKEGYWVMAVRPPTVPEGTARIRISITVDHQEKDLMGLAKRVSEVV